MLPARIDVTDQETRRRELEQAELRDRMFDLLRGHAESHRLQRIAGYSAEFDFDAFAGG